MQDLLPQTLPVFENTSILVVGDVMLDRYWFGDTNRISPEAPVPVVKINNIDNRPGGSANVALNIAALGTQVSLLGITGKDDAAIILQEQLSAAQVDHALITLEDATTIIKLRVLSRHQQLLRLDFEETCNRVNHLPLLEQYQKLLPKQKLVILSDYNKGTLTQAPQLIELARTYNIPVFVDPKGTDFNLYQNCTLLTPNYKEFEAIVGRCHTEQEIAEKAQGLIAKLNIQALLVTRGENGMTLVEGNEVTHFPAYAREVFDVTGAGDTVIGVLGAAYASNLPLKKATALANLAASLVVGKQGAATVSTPELQVALTGKTNFVTGIMNEEQLIQAVKQARVRGKKIVFTNGCFDILHAGHVAGLQMAKQLGDYLIVAVNTDDSIRNLKGPSRPINHMDHRMTVLAGLDVVDWVVAFPDATPCRLLKLIKPDFLVKGNDYDVTQVVGADIVSAYGGEVRIVNPNINTSSTKIINKIQCASPS